ncbi:DUF350 domain-containing protein [Alteromonas aestuariivivens]|uniref:DUF350 domain-containing protein n=1 Tax=Alteromonas aestuariivivens TaxID=1938339 RepID=A0A3D8MEB7_9ALTE|nr:DUF350 domain-containing protein [Alteromonas aestuariivivens]RDV29175.1 DUF350 domain-containing protein [Alteromonas aestuariivivens]
MENLVKLVTLPHDMWVYLAIDLALALMLLVAMKWLTRMFRKDMGSVTEELGVKDNFAFGISIAGGMLSLCIVLASAVGRHIGHGYQNAALGMLTFGVVGIVLVKFGRFAHDKLVLNRLDTMEMISERSVSVALVDAASLVASAIILRSIMLWVEGSNLNAIIAVTTGFMVVLAILLVMTRFYEARYASENQNDSFQGALRKGQLALAIDHTGNLLGTATIVTSAARLLVYDPAGYVSNITGWLVVSVCLAFALQLTVLLSKKIILFGMNYRQEVDHQHNVGVASLGFALSIGIALVVNGVLEFLL